MRKIQLAEEAGRSMAQKRYGSIGSQSKYGHSQMGHNVKGKYQFAAGGAASDPPGYKDPNPALSDITIGDEDEGTDAYYARQEEKRGVPESQRHYGDPDPAPPRRGRPLLKGK